MLILMVEDNDGFVFAAKHEFLAPHNIVVASSLARLPGCLGQRFDVALVDYDLPDGKGDAAVRAIRSRHPTIPIVAISSHAAGNTALMSAGADRVCAKTMFDEIGAVLATLRARHRGP